ncbi:MAG: hypothetical protein KatS3mg111_3695 [Pirellulaceae bacterium]|nr:MAG: hypothetical protein KatS3mg111_3695 [Pirellulaceae bacterium]
MDQQSIDAVIRERRTVKVLADESLPMDPGVESQLEELLETAGWAPFHRACDPVHREGRADGLDGIEPWRFYVLPGESCRKLVCHVESLPEAGKIPSMLRAASGLVLATWLPNPPAGDLPAGSLFQPTLANMEHLAAASAAVQNLLLAATSRGIPNYWSSGGVLRQPEQLERLGIPGQELLLGAIFLFPRRTAGGEVVGSKLRAHRTPPAHWSRFIELV